MVRTFFATNSNLEQTVEGRMKKNCCHKEGRDTLSDGIDRKYSVASLLTFPLLASHCVDVFVGFLVLEKYSSNTGKRAVGLFCQLLHQYG